MTLSLVFQECLVSNKVYISLVFYTFTLTETLFQSLVLMDKFVIQCRDGFL